MSILSELAGLVTDPLIILTSINLANKKKRTSSRWRRRRLVEWVTTGSSNPSRDNWH